MLGLFFVLDVLLNMHILIGVAYAFSASSITIQIYIFVLLSMSLCQEIWLVTIPDSLI